MFLSNFISFNQQHKNYPSGIEMLSFLGCILYLSESPEKVQAELWSTHHEQVQRLESWVSQNVNHPHGITTAKEFAASFFLASSLSLFPN